MNEEEIKAMNECKILMICLYDYMSIEKSRFYCNQYKIILNLIDKQQEEIKARLEEIDSLYKMMSAKDDEIEKLKEDYQILKDDIEGHRIAYVDTPEFEENYISKDKIKEKIEELKQYKEEIKEEKDTEYYTTLRIIKALRKLLVSGQESDQEGGQEDE